MASKYQDEWQQIGLNIAYYRKSRGLTQELLADSIGKSRNHIQRLESGAPASVNTLLDIAQQLVVPVSRLFEFRE